MSVETEEIRDEKALTRMRLLDWFSTALGNSLFRFEKNWTAQVLPGLFGYHILQMGVLGDDHLLESSRINHKAIISFEPNTKIQKSISLFCASDAFPIASESVDVVILPHVLEFENNPHQILRQTQRILIGEGHVVILGFNPWSLWGLWRLFLAWRDRPPWNGKYLRLGRLKDWLTLLDFEIIMHECFYFRPPLKNVNFMQKLTFMEQLGRFCWPYFGGVYILVAKKRVIPLTPIKMQWQTRRHMIASGIAEPTAR